VLQYGQEVEVDDKLSLLSLVSLPAIVHLK